jgi:hypothetical protein
VIYDLKPWAPALYLAEPADDEVTEDFVRVAANITIWSAMIGESPNNNMPPNRPQFK